MATAARVRLRATGFVRVRWHQRRPQDRNTGVAAFGARYAARLGHGDRTGGGAAFLCRASIASGYAGAGDQVDRVRPVRESAAVRRGEGTDPVLPRRVAVAAVARAGDRGGAMMQATHPRDPRSEEEARRVIEEYFPLFS